MSDLTTAPTPNSTPTHRLKKLILSTLAVISFFFVYGNLTITLSFFTEAYTLSGTTYVAGKIFLFVLSILALVVTLWFIWKKMKEHFFSQRFVRRLLISGISLLFSFAVFLGLAFMLNINFYFNESMSQETSRAYASLVASFCSSAYIILTAGFLWGEGQ